MIKDNDLIEAFYTYYAYSDKLSRLVDENNRFAREKIEGFVYLEWELGDFFSGINPYADNRVPRINNTRVIIESIAFENIVIGRKLKANTEKDRSKEAIIQAEKLIDKIDTYLIEYKK